MKTTVVATLRKLRSGELVTQDELWDMLIAMDMEEITLDEAEEVLKLIDKVVEQNPELRRVSKPKVSKTEKYDPVVVRKAREFVWTIRSDNLETVRDYNKYRTFSKWNTAHELFANRIKELKTVISRREDQILEKAKRLAVSNRFQTRLSKLRVKLGITERFPDKNTEVASLVPNGILLHWLGSNFEDDQLDRIWLLLRRRLYEPFKSLAHLDWNSDSDRALLVVALCFGLRPTDLTDPDKKVKIIKVAKNIRTANTVYAFSDEVYSEAIYLLSIAYTTLSSILTTQPDRTHTKIARDMYLRKLPREVSLRCRDAIDLCLYLGIKIEESDVLKQIETVISMLQNVEPRIELVIKVKSYMSTDDIKRSSSLIKLEKFRLWGTNPDSKDYVATWHEFERDVELMQIYEQLNNIEDTVREYQLRHSEPKFKSARPRTPNDEDESAKQRDVELVKKALQRYRRLAGL